MEAPPPATPATLLDHGAINYEATASTGGDDAGESTMQRVLIHLGLLLAVALILACPRRRDVRPQETPAVVVSSGWEALTDRSLRQMWDLYPGLALFHGVRGYETKLPKRRGVDLKRAVDELTSSVQALYSVEPDELTPAERIDRRLLIDNLRLAIHEIAVEGRPIVAPIDDMEQLIRGLSALWLDDSRPVEERMAALAEQLVQMPEYLTVSRENAHKPSRRLCLAAVERSQELRGFIDREVRRLAARMNPELRDRLELGIDEALLGLDNYAAGLEPVCATGPEMIPIGEDNYARRLHYQHGVSSSAEEVEALGEVWLKRAREELLRLPAAAPANTLRAPPGFSRRAFLDAIGKQVKTLRSLVIERDLVTLPPKATPLRVVEVPPLHATKVAAIALRPAPVFGRGEALVVVGLLPAQEPTGAERDRLYRRLADGALLLLTAHETYPGRQLAQMAARRQGSAVRRVQQSVALNDGWALYAAGVALDTGLVMSDEAALRAYWELIRAAAARAVVDARLNTGAITFDQAVRFLGDNTALPGLRAPLAERRRWLEQEVLQMLATPASASAGLLGKVAIDEIRRRAHERTGDPFDLKRFHNSLLSQGSVAPVYIAHALFRDALPDLEPAPSTQPAE